LDLEQTRLIFAFWIFRPYFYPVYSLLLEQSQSFSFAKIPFLIIHELFLFLMVPAKLRTYLSWHSDRKLLQNNEKLCFNKEREWVGGCPDGMLSGGM
jgi:hypothetical protein